MTNKTRLDYLHIERNTKCNYINEQMDTGKPQTTYQGAVDDLKAIDAMIEEELQNKPLMGYPKISRLEYLIGRYNDIYEANKKELDAVAKTYVDVEKDWTTCRNSTRMKALKASNVPTGLYWSKKASRNHWKPQNAYPRMIAGKVNDIYNAVFEG